MFETSVNVRSAEILYQHKSSKAKYKGCLESRVGLPFDVKIKPRPSESYEYRDSNRMFREFHGRDDTP